jgi:hypothetical protein
MGFELAGEAVAEEVFAGEVAGEAVAASTAYTAADAAALGAMTEGAAVAGGALAGGALLRVGVQLGLSFLVSKLFSPKLNRAETSQGTLVNSLTTVDPIPVIYGTRRVGATVCPVGVSGPSQEFLHLICVWGEGPVSAIGIVYLDGVATTDGKFAGLVTREDFLGTDGQAASGTLVAAMADASKWNASCTLAGIAYTYLILKWDQTVFARGRPLITADVNGRTLFDPRTSTTGFSRNPALALRDYLTNSRYGRGYGSGAIDDATFAEATYHCDDLVARPGGATQARYVCDGVVNPDDAPLDIVKGLLLACRGNLIYSGGKYKLKIDRGYWGVQSPGVASEHVAALSAASLNFGTGSFSVEGWFRHDDFTFPRSTVPLNKQGSTWNTTPGWGVGQGYQNAGINVFICDGPNLVSATIPYNAGITSSGTLLGSLHHIGVVFDRGAGVARLYVDGVKQTTTLSIATVTGSVNNASNFQVGLSVGWMLDGLADGVRLYGRALSDADVAEHYKGAFRDETSLALRWEFDEGQGTTAYDWSGQGNHGTLANGPTYASQLPGYMLKFVLSEGNILGAWSWQQPGRRTRFNAVKARFYDPATNYLPNITVWPPAGGAQSVAYLAQDNGLVLASQLELPFTTNLYTAQQICQVEAKKSRNPLLVSLNATIAAMALEVGDIVPVAHATPGWPAVGDPAEGKLFRVEEVELLASDEVRLGLRLYDAAAYSLDALTLQPSLTLTSLPDASIVAVPLNVAASSGTNQLFIAGDGTVVSRLLVTWDVSTNAFVTSGGRVIVQFKRQSDAAWQNFTSLDGSATQAYLTPVDDGITYDVRVAFENQMQARSSWVQISHTVIGKTAAPSDVTGFQVNGTRLSWNPVTDSDLWGYRVRFQAGSSQSWGDAVWLHGQGAAQQDVLTTPPFTIPAGIGVGQATLMMKAVDLSGNESQNPAILVVNLSGASVANVVQTFDRKSAGFPGTQTNCAVDGSGNLAANSTTLMWSSDDRASMWKADSTSLMWAVAAFAQLQYEDRIVTTGSRAGSTLTLSAAVSGDPWRIEYRENSTKAMWGADASALMWNASASTLMWDAPAYLTWPGQVSVFPDSMFDLRITAGQAQTQGKITGLTVTLDAPDISETLANVAISSGGTRLAPLRSYGTVKSVQLTVVTDGGAAVSATQEDTQATGPLIKARDGSGVAVNGHVNARIEGY